jgi:hypothetical protein
MTDTEEETLEIKITERQREPYLGSLADRGLDDATLIHVALLAHEDIEVDVLPRRHASTSPNHDGTTGRSWYSTFQSGTRER